MAVLKYKSSDGTWKTIATKGGNGVTDETDPVFSASPAASITEEKKAEWDNKMDKVTLATVATSGSYNDLSNKPTIPSAVTESTVSGWGFTKNTGTYSKPSGGIPKTDLASAVQTSLGKADTAIQSIKTINGQSIVGSGNITIEGGGGSGKANYPFTHIMLLNEENVVTLEPNTYYWIESTPLEWGRGAYIDIMLSEPQDTSIVNEYVFEVTGGATISLPSDIFWVNGNVPDFQDGHDYLISIVNYWGCYAKL